MQGNLSLRAYLISPNLIKLLYSVLGENKIEDLFKLFIVENIRNIEPDYLYIYTKQFCDLLTS